MKKARRFLAGPSVSTPLSIRLALSSPTHPTDQSQQTRTDEHQRGRFRHGVQVPVRRFGGRVVAGVLDAEDVFIRLKRVHGQSVEAKGQVVRAVDAHVGPDTPNRVSQAPARARIVLARVRREELVFIASRSGQHHRRRVVGQPPEIEFTERTDRERAGEDRRRVILVSRRGIGRENVVNAAGAV